MLSDERIAKFQLLYQRRFGREISREDAYEQGVKLIRLLEIIYKPMTVDDYEKLQARRRETGDL